MLEIVRATPPTLFAIAAIMFAYVALDLGRRWIAERAQRVREANERMDELEKTVADRLDVFDKAIVIAAKGVAELGERVGDLEAQTKTDSLARGFSRRRPNPLEG